MLIAKLESKSGAILEMGYDFKSSFQELLDNRAADCFIVATEYGFSPLGLAGEVMAKELDLEKDEIVKIAGWNRNDNPAVSLIGVKSRQNIRRSLLKGAVLAASQTSKSYQPFVQDGIYSKPSRDFFYNVTYEAIYYAVHTLKARKLAISHLSASGNYHEDMATCTAEALAHFHDAYPGKIDSFLFVGCCINPDHFKGIKQLNAEGELTQHMPTEVHKTEKDGFDVITLRSINTQNNRRTFAFR